VFTNAELVTSDASGNQRIAQTSKLTCIALAFPVP
jgi:hypothetical protein